MKTKQVNPKTDIVRILVNGNCVTLHFALEPNKEAANYVKKTLINAYMTRSVPLD